MIMLELLESIRLISVRNDGRIEIGYVILFFKLFVLYSSCVYVVYIYASSIFDRYVKDSNGVNLIG